MTPEAINFMARHARGLICLTLTREHCERLQLAPDYVQPAYEDIHYYLWRENRLPANVITKAAELVDPLERARLARVFGHGLGNPVGSVLPLRRLRRTDTSSVSRGSDCAGAIRQTDRRTRAVFVALPVVAREAPRGADG